MCMQKSKSHSHVFLHCPLALRLWCFLFFFFCRVRVLAVTRIGELQMFFLIVLWVFRFRGMVEVLLLGNEYRFTLPRMSFSLSIFPRFSLGSWIGSFPSNFFVRDPRGDWQAISLMPFSPLIWVALLRCNLFLRS